MKHSNEATITIKIATIILIGCATVMALFFGPFSTINIFFSII